MDSEESISLLVALCIIVYVTKSELEFQIWVLHKLGPLLFKRCKCIRSRVNEIHRL